MTKVKTGNSKFLKNYNETGLLDLVRVRGQISRAELSRLTGLSPTAVGAITQTLIEKEYLLETGIGTSRGGRRPVLLELKPGSLFTAGVDLEVSHMYVVLADIKGSIVAEQTFSAPEYGNYRSVALVAERIIRDMLAAVPADIGKLLGIGISVPGMVDGATRRITLAPNLGWHDVDIRSCFIGFGDIPVYVENEAMASAICENWVGCCTDIGNFVCINIKSGIGAGIFTSGRPYRGEGGSAGEVGHTMVDENGPKCGCGNYGCLETLASTPRIVENARRLVRQGAVSGLDAIDPVDRLTLEDIVRFARAGDGTAAGVLDESARYLGLAIANLVNTLNPSSVVLGKDFTRYADLVLDRIRGIVESKALKLPASRVRIVSSSVGDRSSALGAAIVPLKTLFGK